MSRGLWLPASGKPELYHYLDPKRNLAGKGRAMHGARDVGGRAAAAAEPSAVGDDLHRPDGDAPIITGLWPEYFPGSGADAGKLAQPVDAGVGPQVMSARTTFPGLAGRWPVASRAAGDGVPSAVWPAGYLAMRTR